MQGKLVELEDGFGAYKMYNRWVGGSDAYKTALARQLQVYCEGTNGAYPKKTGGGAMSPELILRVQSQWGELMIFVDTFYIELTIPPHSKPGH
jgi:hypothetical protein